VSCVSNMCPCRWQLTVDRCLIVTIALSSSSSSMVSTLASTYEVNIRQAQLVLRWVTTSGFNSRCRKFILLCNQPPKANSAFHPSRVSKWVPASAKKACSSCTAMVHSVSGWTRGVQVKLWDPLRTCAIPERLRGVFMMRRNTNQRLPLPLFTGPCWRVGFQHGVSYCCSVFGLGTDGHITALLNAPRPLVAKIIKDQPKPKLQSNIKCEIMDHSVHSVQCKKTTLNQSTDAKLTSMNTS